MIVLQAIGVFYGTTWATIGLLGSLARWANRRRSARAREASTEPLEVWAAGHGPLPPGDGCSIEDYYFEHALD